MEMNMRRYFRTKIWIIIGRNIVILEMFAATFDVQISAPVENKFMVSSISFHVRNVLVYIYIYILRAGQEMICCSKVT